MGFWTKLLGLEPQKLPVSITDENFEREVLRSPVPVLVDAWSPGCMPCKQLEPIVMSLMEQYDGRIRFAEINIATAPGAARRLGIRATPTVVYFRNRREVERAVGLRGEVYHQRVIEAVLLR